MEKILLFFKNISPVILLIVSIALEVLSKIIEKYSANTAMFLQLLFFILFLSAIYKFLNRKK
jgi:multidrug transporter EmrE-like cation transporter